MNSIPDFSTALFPRHVSLAQSSPDLGSCADLNCTFLPHQKSELFPQCRFTALVLTETQLCSSLAKGHCHGSCCPLWALLVPVAASQLDCPGKHRGRREGRGCVVPAGAPHRAAGWLCKRRWAEGTAGEQQFCSARPPEQIQEGFSCTGKRECLNSHSELCSGKRKNEWKVDVPVFAVFLLPEFKLMALAGYTGEYIKWVKPETGSWMS